MELMLVNGDLEAARAEFRRVINSAEHAVNRGRIARGYWHGHLSS